MLRFLLFSILITFYCNEALPQSFFESRFLNDDSFQDVKLAPYTKEISSSSAEIKLKTNIFKLGNLLEQIYNCLTKILHDNNFDELCGPNCIKKASNKYDTMKYDSLPDNIKPKLRKYVTNFEIPQRIKIPKPESINKYYINNKIIPYKTIKTNFGPLKSYSLPNIKTNKGFIKENLDQSSIPTISLSPSRSYKPQKYHFRMNPLKSSNININKNALPVRKSDPNNTFDVEIEDRPDVEMSIKKTNNKEENIKIDNSSETTIENSKEVFATSTENMAKITEAELTTTKDNNFVAVLNIPYSEGEKAQTLINELLSNLNNKLSTEAKLKTLVEVSRPYEFQPVMKKRIIKLISDVLKELEDNYATNTLDIDKYHTLISEILNVIPQDFLNGKYNLRQSNLKNNQQTAKSLSEMLDEFESFLKEHTGDNFENSKNEVYDYFINILEMLLDNIIRAPILKD